MKKVFLLVCFLFCMLPLSLSGQNVSDVIRLRTSHDLSKKKEAFICIWAQTISGRISVTGAELQEDRYVDGEPNYYKLTSNEVAIEGDVTYINLDDNHLTKIDLSGNKYLRSLFCANNELQSIDLSNCGFLRVFDGHNNRLTSLDFTACTELRYASVDRNMIVGEAMTNMVTSLPVRKTGDGEARLFVVDSKNNEGNICLQSDVALAKAKLWGVFDYFGGANEKRGVPYEGSSDAQKIEGNHITATTSKALETNIYVHVNPLTPDACILWSNGEKTPLANGNQAIALKSQTFHIVGGYTSIDLSWDDLTSLDLSHHETLEDLHLFANLLTEIDLSKNARLQTVRLNRNLLEKVVFNNPLLSTLNLSDNRLEHIDLTSLRGLQSLFLNSNKLTSLDCVANKRLAVLGCSNNQLTSLNVPDLVDLVNLFIDKNKIDKTHMEAIVDQLNDTQTNSGKYLRAYNPVGEPAEENFFGTKAADRAIAKYWSPFYYDEDNNWVDFHGLSSHHIVKSDLVIYPNPAMERLFFTRPILGEKILRSLSGVEVLRSVAEDGLDVSFVPEGTYLLHTSEGPFELTIQRK